MKIYFHLPRLSVSSSSQWCIFSVESGLFAALKTQICQLRAMYAHCLTMALLKKFTQIRNVSEIQRFNSLTDQNNLIIWIINGSYLRLRRVGEVISAVCTIKRQGNINQWRHDSLQIGWVGNIFALWYVLQVLNLSLSRLEACYYQ